MESDLVLNVINVLLDSLRSAWCGAIEVCTRHTGSMSACALVGLEAGLWLFVSTVLKLRRSTPILGRLKWWKVWPYAASVIGVVIILATPSAEPPIWQLTLGILVFVMGLGQRHGQRLMNLLKPARLFGWPASRFWRGVYRYLFGSSLRLPRYTGLLWELGGISLLSGSIKSSLLGLGLLLAACIAVTFQRGSQLLPRLQPSLQSVPARVGYLLDKAQVGRGVILASLVWGLLGSATGSLDLVDSEAASATLSALITAQAIFGLLPLSFVMVLVEVSSGIYSTRLVRRVAGTWEAWAGLGLLSSSLLLDLLLVANPAQHAGVMPDVAFVWAWVVTVCAVWIARGLPRRISPKHLMREVLSKLDESWFRRVSQTYGPRVPPWRYLGYDDPFRDVERLLVATIEQNDRQTFEDLTIMLAEHLKSTFGKRKRRELLEYEGLSPENEGIFDSFLADQLLPLIEQAAERRMVWALNEVIDLRERIHPVLWRREPTSATSATLRPEPPPVDLIEGKYRKPPYPNLLLGEVIEAALEARLEKTAEKAGYAIARELNRALANCPGERLWAWNQPRRWSGAEDDEDARRRQDQRYPSLIYFNFLTYLKTEALQAVRLDMADAAGVFAGVISRIFDSAPDLTADPEVVRAVCRIAVMDLEEIGRASARQPLACVVSWPGKWAIWREGTPHDEMMAQLMVQFASEILLRLAQAGVLDFGLVDGACMSSVYLASRFPEEVGQLILVLHGCAETIRDLEDHPWDTDPEWRRDWIYRRIDQARREAGTEREKLDAVLGIDVPLGTVGEQLAAALRDANTGAEE